MALSSTPADPPSSGAAAATPASAAATATPRLFSNPPLPSRDQRPPPHYPPHAHHPTTYSQPQQSLYVAQPLPSLVPRVTANANYPQLGAKPHEPPQGILYPVASSGRGFLQRAVRPPSADQTVTIANPGGFPPRPVAPAAYSHSHPVRPFGFAHSDSQGQGVHLVRPNHLQHTLLGSSAGVMSGMIKGVPVSSHQKVAPSQPVVPKSNGYKDVRGSSKDDSFVTIEGRKVRISEGSSLYALCRSWLRNGFSEDSQPQYVDGLKSLPKPAPPYVADGHSPVKKEDDTEAEEEGSVEHLSTADLLQRHIKRAKKVRSRLREERLHRIARYKTRLALLLPPLVEQQQFRNETAAGN